MTQFKDYVAFVEKKQENRDYGNGSTELGLSNTIVTY